MFHPAAQTISLQALDTIINASWLGSVAAEDFNNKEKIMGSGADANEI